MKTPSFPWLMTPTRPPTGLTIFNQRPLSQGQKTQNLTNDSLKLKRTAPIPKNHNNFFQSKSLPNHKWNKDLSSSLPSQLWQNPFMQAAQVAVPLAAIESIPDLIIKLTHFLPNNIYDALPTVAALNTGLMLFFFAAHKPDIRLPFFRNDWMKSLMLFAVASAALYGFTDWAIWWGANDIASRTLLVCIITLMVTHIDFFFLRHLEQLSTHQKGFKESREEAVREFSQTGSRLRGFFEKTMKTHFRFFLTSAADEINALPPKVQEHFHKNVSDLLESFGHMFHLENNLEKAIKALKRANTPEKLSAASLEAYRSLKEYYEGLEIHIKTVNRFNLTGKMYMLIEPPIVIDGMGPDGKVINRPLNREADGSLSVFDYSHVNMFYESYDWVLKLSPKPIESSEDSEDKKMFSARERILQKTNTKGPK